MKNTLMDIKLRAGLKFKNQCILTLNAPAIQSFPHSAKIVVIEAGKSLIPMQNTPANVRNEITAIFRPWRSIAQQMKIMAGSSTSPLNAVPELQNSLVYESQYKYISHLNLQPEEGLINPKYC